MTERTYQILAFPLRIGVEQIIGMPENAQILSVIARGDTPTLYASFTPGDRFRSLKVKFVESSERSFRLSRDAQFVGTVQTRADDPVWHVFVERVEEGWAGRPQDDRRCRS